MHLTLLSFISNEEAEAQRVVDDLAKVTQRGSSCLEGSVLRSRSGRRQSWKAVLAR